MNFYGYKRPDGRVGVRNKVLILPASVCASDTTRIISQQVVGSVTFNNQLGCSQVAPDQQFTMDVMAGYAANPNVYGTVVVSLGCENCQMDLVVKAIQERTNKPLKQVIIQEAGGTLKAIDMAVRYAKEMVEEASLLQKEEFPMSELIIGTECGGSDPTSGLAANPLIGQLSDLIVKEGGTSILSETTEFIGAEHLLARRAINKEVHDRIFAHYDEMAAALRDADKLSRQDKVAELKEAIKAEFTEEEQLVWEREIPVNLKKLEKTAMRRMVVETGERVDGRTAAEIRPIMVKGDYLPLVHGSGLFQRGQTQVLSVLSLGMLNEGQRLDTIEPVDGKRYMHHYNFPPYCTGETGRMGTPKRREIGHGNLAERALIPVLPDENEFPYAIRVVSEVMESNGSSSMASTCGSCLALMDGGVPIKRPVSGIAMGLIQEEGKTVVLSDIQGLEDFLGDMDFKVTGTEKGITALQMDNKATGLTFDILRTALEQAKEGRAYILDKMLEVVPGPREETRATAPKIQCITIPTENIRDVIGKGGETIRGIQDETGASIDIHEDGTVYVGGVGESVAAAIERIELIVKVPEVGEDYTGRVVSIQPFGAFVNLLPGKDGLLHISRVAQGRVEKVEDVLNVGDEVKVKVIEIDDRGKISLTMVKGRMGK